MYGGMMSVYCSISTDWPASLGLYHHLEPFAVYPALNNSRHEYGADDLIPTYLTTKQD